MTETHRKNPLSAGPFSTDPFLVARDHMVSGEAFELLPNEGGELLKTVPVPSDLGKYYASSAYYSHRDDTGNLMARIYRQARTWNTRWKIRLVKYWAKEAGSLLEIGSGTGNFLLAAKNSGWEVTGVEPDAGARKLAEQKGLSLQTSLKDLPYELVDVITLWHVLEHIPDLEATLLELYSRLNPNGYLILALPNFKSWDARYYKAKWAGYDVPRHLWHFSRKGINRLMKDAGFQEQQQKPMRLDAFYVSWLSEKYRKNPIGPIAAFFIGLWSNLSAAFTGEYSSVAYVFKKEASKRANPTK